MLRISLCRSESGTARLFDLLGKPTGGEIALDPQRLRNRERLSDRRLFKMAPVPQGARAEFVERPMVETRYAVRGRVSGSAIPEFFECQSMGRHFPGVARATGISEWETGSAAGQSHRGAEPTRSFVNPRSKSGVGRKSEAHSATSHQCPAWSAGALVLSPWVWFQFRKNVKKFLFRS